MKIFNVLQCNTKYCTAFPFSYFCISHEGVAVPKYPAIYDKGVWTVYVPEKTDGNR